MGNRSIHEIVNSELALLAKVSECWKIPTEHVAQALTDWKTQSLPDTLPSPPAWVKFKWPKDGNVPYTPREKNGRWSPWMQEYL